MEDRELVAILSAIIYASPKWPRSQDVGPSVEAAKRLLSYVEFPTKEEDNGTEG